MQPQLQTEIIKPLDYNQFKLYYKKDIRCIIYWDAIKKPFKTGVTIIYPEKTEYHIFLPNRKPGVHFLNGRLKQWNINKNGKSIVRIPALRTAFGYVVLDGVHRLLELKPNIVIIDYLVVPKKRDYKYFADLLNYIRG